MEKNATVYVVEIDYNKMICPDKETALKLFETLVASNCNKYETASFDQKYPYVGSNCQIALKAYVVNLYNCGEEARVAKQNEEKLIKSGIMKDKRKGPKIKDVKKIK